MHASPPVRSRSARNPASSAIQICGSVVSLRMNRSNASAAPVSRSDSQLAWLCREGRVEAYPPGPVYTEGDPATCFYVLLNGTLVMSRRVEIPKLKSDEDLIRIRLDRRGREANRYRNVRADE